MTWDQCHTPSFLSFFQCVVLCTLLHIFLHVCSPPENLEKKKCNLDYLVIVLLYNPLTYSMLKFFVENKK